MIAKSLQRPNRCACGADVLIDDVTHCEAMLRALGQVCGRHESRPVALHAACAKAQASLAAACSNMWRSFVPMGHSSSGKDCKSSPSTRDDGSETHLHAVEEQKLRPHRRSANKLTSVGLA